MKLNAKFTVIILAFVFVPIAVLSILFFQNMEQNTIQESHKDVQYALERSYVEIYKNVDNINMSTQFFLGDKSLFEYLKKIHHGESISYEEMMNFYNVNISSLERMVNSNPNIYQIRVYVDSSTMEEMMPILYRYNRMNRLSWAHDEELRGWKFDYMDTTFDAYTMDRDVRLLAFVAPIQSYHEGTLGILEVAMQMNTMFPEIYNSTEHTIAFFVDQEGTVYCAEENRSRIAEYEENGFLEGMAEGSQDNVITTDKKWQGISCTVGSRYIKELNGTLVYVNNLEESIGVLHKNRNIFLIVLGMTAIVLTILVNWVVRRLLSRFYRILQSIREVQKGNLDMEIENCGNDEMGELGTQINKMMKRIRQLMEDNLNRELLVKNSEIRALQNQINAHFIYNVLESIKMMAEIEEKYDISDAITTLGKMLRYSMRWSSGIVTVGEELEYIRNYITLINLRFDYEIYLSLNLPDMILYQKIPKMSLQPIVENAIYHGIEQMAEDTNIYVKGWLEDGDCIIEITDAGKGMTDEQVEELHRRINGEIEAGEGSGNGIGLKNVQDRIKINFGDKYGLHISSRLGCYTKVQVRTMQTYFEQGEA